MLPVCLLVFPNLNGGHLDLTSKSVRVCILAVRNV